jgi:hypothetical protein
MQQCFAHVEHRKCRAGHTDFKNYLESHNMVFDNIPAVDTNVSQLWVKRAKHLHEVFKHIVQIACNDTPTLSPNPGLDP